MYRQHYSTRETAQSEVIPGKDMVENSAGGYSFAVDDWVRLDRFLILGSEGGSYYASEKKLTIENANAVQRCIQSDGLRVVNRIVEISKDGRAPKNDPALFALAMCAGMGNDETRQKALDVLPEVARIGTHLFHFLEYVEGFRGWGRGLRRAVSNWYNDMPVLKLAYQALKYQRRDGWSHRDALRLSHPIADTTIRDALYRYIVGKDSNIAQHLSLIDAFEQAGQSDSKRQIRGLIEENNLSREMIPTKWLNEPEIWGALLPKMPLTALIRNLGKMTSIGLLKPMSSEVSTATGKITNLDYIRKSRLHPLSILVALKIYSQGHGMKGSLKWEPVGAIVDALDKAFYLSFGNVKPTGKRTMLALDVSGSMSANIAGMPLSCRSASAALAMVTAKTESQYMVTMFSSAGSNFKSLIDSGNNFGWYDLGISELPISPNQRLDDIEKSISNLPFGGTDCALPMLYALKRDIKVDTFIIYTDSETWAGHIHPIQALQEYRKITNIPAKLIVVGMVSNGFSIADPDDNGMLDCVGFDTSVPQIISDFSR